jgi:hypothetical protein
VLASRRERERVVVEAEQGKGKNCVFIPVYGEGI